MMTETVKQSWEEITKLKRNQRESLISPFSIPVNGEHNVSKAILDIRDIQPLSELLSSGKLKSQDLIRYYAQR